MRFNEIQQQLDESPRSRFKQAAKGIASRVFSRLPGGRALALNWAARADLDATINGTYEDFSEFLGQRDKSYKQATGEDLKAFLQRKGINFSNEAAIPSGQISPKDMDSLLTRIVFEAVTGISDRETQGDAAAPDQIRDRARSLFGDRINIGGDSRSSDEPPRSDDSPGSDETPPELDDEPASDDAPVDDEPESDEEPVTVSLPERVFIVSSEGDRYFWTPDGWRTGSPRGESADAPEDVVSRAQELQQGTIPDGVGIVSSSGNLVLEKVDGEWQEDGEPLSDQEAATVESYILQGTSDDPDESPEPDSEDPGADPDEEIDDDEPESDDEPEKMEDVIVTDSDGNEFYWAGAQWINAANGRMARRTIRDELESQVPNKVSSREEIPTGTKIRLAGETYTWRGVQWVSNKGRIARRTVQNELDQKVIQE